MALLAAALVLSWSPAEVLGGTGAAILQVEPLIPDTLRPDTLRPDTIRPDTLGPETLLPDTLPPDPIPGDTLEPTDAQPDTLRQVLPRNLPAFPGGAPPRSEAGVWVWDRSDLLGSEALTLHDLLTLVPGLIPLRGGDYGTPVAVTTAGFGPGQVRLFLDGIEDPPKEGGVVDLSQVGLAGVDEVRVERRPGELRIHLTTLQLTEGRPYTHLDVGTGDLRTNLFRATFAHPSILGGTFLVGLDRLDTQGDGPDNDAAPGD